MDTRVSCPNPSCQKSLKVPAAKSLSALKCPKCGTSFKLQTAGSTVAPAPLNVAEMATMMTLPPPDPMPQPMAVEIPRGPAAEVRSTGKKRNLVASEATRTVEPASGGLLGMMLFGCMGFVTISFVIAGIVGGIIAYKMVKEKTDEPGTAVVGKRKLGGIEVGSKSVKAAVADLFDTEEGYDFDLKDSIPTVTSLGQVPKDSREFDPKAVEETVEAIRKYHTQMLDAGVAPDDIQVVCGSGPFRSIHKNQVEAVKRELAAKIKEATHLTVGFVEPADEARLAIRVCVPQRDRTRSLLVDVGSGGIRGGFYTLGNNFTALELNYGVDRFHERAEATRGRRPITLAARANRETLLSAPLRAEVSRKPGLASQPRVYLNGGLIWAVAVFTHPNELPRTRVALTPSDFDQFRGLLELGDSEEIRRRVLAPLPDGELRENVDNEITLIFHAFSLEKLQTAGEILVALNEELKLETKQVTFFRKGQYAWLLGYIFEQRGIE